MHILALLGARASLDGRLPDDHATLPCLHDKRPPPLASQGPPGRAALGLISGARPRDQHSWPARCVVRRALCASSRARYCAPAGRLSALCKRRARRALLRLLLAHAMAPVGADGTGHLRVPGGDINRTGCWEPDTPPSVTANVAPGMQHIALRPAVIDPWARFPLWRLRQKAAASPLSRRRESLSTDRPSGAPRSCSMHPGPPGLGNFSVACPARAPA